MGMLDPELVDGNVCHYNCLNNKFYNCLKHLLFKLEMIAIILNQ